MVGENPKFGRNKKKGLIGSKSRRQTLSDITNTGRNQENPNTTIYPDSKDLIELTKVLKHFNPSLQTLPNSLSNA